MTPEVSVILPVYNCENYIVETVESVLKQTFKDFELILINDGSTDNSMLRVLKFTDPRIKIVNQKNRGAASARNFGIRTSAGAFIGFIDGDDLWLPDKIEKQLKCFEKNRDSGVVYTQRLNIDQDGQVYHGYQPKLYSGWVLDRLYVDNFVCMSSSLVRREVFETVGLLNEDLRMSEDFEFWLRVACQDPFTHLDDALVCYRNHPAQISRHTDLRVKVVWEIREEFNKTHRQFVGPKAYRRAKALHFSHKAHRREGRDKKLTVLRDYCRALTWEPFDEFTWRGIVRLLAPAPVMNWYRRFSGRSTHRCADTKADK